MLDRHRLVSTSSANHPLHVVAPTGLPDIPLTLFANELGKSLSRSSVPLYVREVLSLVDWARRDPVTIANGWNLFGEPRAVRNILREYLRVAAKCKVTEHPGRFRATPVRINATAETAIQVRVLLAALKRLYGVLGAAGLYAHANPLAHEDAAQIASKLYEFRYQAMLAAEGRGPMPASSGVDSPPGIRCPENYFRFVDQQWVPKSIDDPAFPNVVYAAGKAHGWSLRELCIVRTLFEAGPRISEVLSLTALDWMPSHFTNAFRCPNKGSHGQRTKTLMVSQATAKLFRKYFDDDVGGRRAWDPQRHTVATLTNLSTRIPDELSRIPLFLTARGSVMTAKLFRDEHWRPALRAAGLDAHPHLARHWFVTNALRNIEAYSQDQGEMCRRRQELIQYMGWRSGEQTLKAYEHVRREHSFLKQLSLIHKVMRRSEKNYAKRGAGSIACDPEPSRTSTELAFLLGEDDEC